jgi:hypothetical protein
MKSLIVSLQTLALLALSVTGIGCAAPTAAEDGEASSDIEASPFMVMCDVEVPAGLPVGKAAFRLFVPDVKNTSTLALNGSLTMPSKSASGAVSMITRKFDKVAVEKAFRSDSATPTYNLTFPRGAHFEQIIQGNSSTDVEVKSFTLSSSANTIEIAPLKTGESAIKAKLKNCKIPTFELNRFIKINGS